MFTFCSDVHDYKTVSSTADKIFKPFYRPDPYEKNSITIGAINSRKKPNVGSVICHLEYIAQPKLIVYFLKTALKTINEKVKWGNFN